MYFTPFYVVTLPVRYILDIKGDVSNVLRMKLQSNSSNFTYSITSWM